MLIRSKHCAPFLWTLSGQYVQIQTGKWLLPGLANGVAQDGHAELLVGDALVMNALAVRHWMVYRYLVPHRCRRRWSTAKPKRRRCLLSKQDARQGFVIYHILVCLLYLDRAAAAQGPTPESSDEKQSAVASLRGFLQHVHGTHSCWSTPRLLLAIHALQRRRRRVCYLRTRISVVRARGLPFGNRYLCETGRAVEPLGGSPPGKLYVWRRQKTIGR